eukprot:TRINITY_DN3386_c0_g2_i1.p1 TRINITY_DN3386_c0_g2~~TRINITY_DN3386_c0_g2_i1.p1  ORF type:complete len:138 (+),score=17.96 TRINITY_DN3386_c0_g2_i1:160-573(+)
MNLVVAIEDCGAQIGSAAVTLLDNNQEFVSLPAHQLGKGQSFFITYDLGKQSKLQGVLIQISPHHPPPASAVISISNDPYGRFVPLRTVHFKKGQASDLVDFPLFSASTSRYCKIQFIPSNNKDQGRYVAVQRVVFY